MRGKSCPTHSDAKPSLCFPFFSLPLLSVSVLFLLHSFRFRLSNANPLPFRPTARLSLPSHHYSIASRQTKRDSSYHCLCKPFLFRSGANHFFSLAHRIRAFPFLITAAPFFSKAFLFHAFPQQRSAAPILRYPIRFAAMPCNCHTIQSKANASLRNSHAFRQLAQCGRYPTPSP